MPAPALDIHANRPTRRLTAVATAVIALALMSGCGGGSDSPTSSASTTAGSQPKEQLVQQADQICTTENEKRPTAPEFKGSEPSSEDLKAAVGYFETDLEVTQETLDQLSKLSPPEGVESQWSTLLGDIRDGVIGNYPELVSAARAGDAAAFLTAIKKIQAGTTELPQLASEIGLKVCATGG